MAVATTAAPSAGFIAGKSKSAELPTLASLSHLQNPVLLRSSVVKIQRVNESHQREYLELLGAILHDHDEYRELLAQKEELAQAMLDLLQSLTDCHVLPPQSKSSIIQAMVRLSRMSNLFPQCLAIHNVERSGKHPIAAGAFGEVWRGGWRANPWEHNSNDVCVKVLRLYNEGEILKASKSFMREAIIWQQLHHPNVLPFFGIYYLNGDGHQLCLTSPWMEKRNLSYFLEVTPRSEVNHIRLVWDIANGLSYLHETEIIHADLKGANVLISNANRAIIADFGLSRVGDGQILQMASKTTNLSGGTTRWISPEVLLNKQNRPTYESDMYAFACVCYEIYTNRLPFHDLQYDVAVIIELSQGNRPLRPSKHEFPEVTDEIWGIISECWTNKPSARPAANDIRQRAEALSRSSGTPIEPPPNWDPHIYQSIRSNVQHNVDVYNNTELDRYISASYARIASRKPNLRSREEILSNLNVVPRAVQHLWGQNPESEEQGKIYLKKSLTGAKEITFDEWDPITHTGAEVMPSSSSSMDQSEDNSTSYADQSIASHAAAASTASTSLSSRTTALPDTKQYFTQPPHQHQLNTPTHIRPTHPFLSSPSLSPTLEPYPAPPPPSIPIVALPVPPTATYNNSPHATVRYTFTPSHKDELPIKIGENITVLKVYNDGWALCTNGNLRGVVPLECLNFVSQGRGQFGGGFDADLTARPPNSSSRPRTAPTMVLPPFSSFFASARPALPCKISSRPGSSARLSSPLDLSHSTIKPSSSNGLHQVPFPNSGAYRPVTAPASTFAVDHEDFADGESPFSFNLPPLSTATTPPTTKRKRSFSKVESEPTERESNSRPPSRRLTITELCEPSPSNLERPSTGSRNPNEHSSSGDDRPGTASGITNGVAGLVFRENESVEQERE